VKIALEISQNLILEHGNGPKELLQDLARKVRPVKTRPPTITQRLGNWRRECAEMNMQEKAPCTCHHYPTKWKRLGNWKGHFCILGKDYNGVGNQCFKVSNKTIIASETTRESTTKEIREAIKDFVRRLPYEMKQKIGDEEIAREMGKSAHQRKIRRVKSENNDQGINEKTIEEAKAYLKYAIISEIDKKRGEMCIM